MVHLGMRFSFEESPQTCKHRSDHDPKRRHLVCFVHIRMLVLMLQSADGYYLCNSKVYNTHYILRKQKLRLFHCLWMHIMFQVAFKDGGLGWHVNQVNGTPHL